MSRLPFIAFRIIILYDSNCYFAHLKTLLLLDYKNYNILTNKQKVQSNVIWP